MYYVNHEQIDLRLAQVPMLLDACRELQEEWGALALRSGELLLHLAQERLLHLAIEIVTDVGSLLIDAFMMRDASSYEDIIDILEGEGVFSAEVAATFKDLVQLRRPLVQDYPVLRREGLHPLISRLPAAMQSFADAVPAFISKEKL
ncbi:DUF86 domain-containing protein [Paenibacillus allorhizosphaerae]|uniref:DUF86 domain-containing protein n=1 Tax=Paenibacillus allorhizosphaerae TaxID=2849866 RepID=A0ABM8VTE6_9BACL|nr:HepT-like ribonuclease domain-containing protein [Paenibacillus allorhizosphaerae]CAG7657331.1 hypothetical protein PAECIP111802_06696 [Paenibacillus allorhizosphaerae]